MSRYRRHTWSRRHSPSENFFSRSVAWIFSGSFLSSLLIHCSQRLNRHEIEEIHQSKEYILPRKKDNYVRMSFSNWFWIHCEWAVWSTEYISVRFGSLVREVRLGVNETYRHIPCSSKCLKAHRRWRKVPLWCLWKHSTSEWGFIISVRSSCSKAERDWVSSATTTCWLPGNFLFNQCSECDPFSWSHFRVTTALKISHRATM